MFPFAPHGLAIVFNIECHTLRHIFLEFWIVVLHVEGNKQNGRIAKVEDFKHAHERSGRSEVEEVGANNVLAHVKVFRGIADVALIIDVSVEYFASGKSHCVRPFVSVD